MKKIALALVSLLLASAAHADVKIGKPAPNFTAKSAYGKNVKLSDFKGKIVVLEWNNPGCPFVRKFYGGGTMQKFQDVYTKKDVVWLSINSSAKGHEGYVDAKGALMFMHATQAVPTDYLLDASGKVGHLYGAKTTPHMFVIDSKGILAYAGAIDDKPNPNPKDIAGAHNYVTTALDELLAGKPVTTASTQAYGCNVKY